MNVSRPNFAADGLPTNLRNAQLASFFEFSFIFAAALESGRKRTMPIEKLGSSSLVSSIFKREGKLHCSLKDDNFAARLKNKCLRHL